MTVINTSELDALKARMIELEQEMQNAGKTFFTNAAQDLFDKYPELDEFSWTQYTPYFNDGDECIFSVHSDYPEGVVNGERVDELTKSYGTWDSVNRKYIPKAESELTLEDRIGEDLTTLLGAVPTNTMKQMFGDHVKVTVNREGIVVEDYDHD